MFKSPPSPADGTFALDPHLPGTPWKEHFRQQCCCTLPLCERSVYFNACVNHLGSRLTNISSSETLLLLYSASIDVLKFDILTWETRGRGVDWGTLKDAYWVFPSLFPLFFHCSLFHCSLAFSARQHWPRAWHRLFPLRSQLAHDVSYSGAIMV